MTELTVEQKVALYDTIRPEIRKLAHQMEMKFRLHDNERGNPFDCNDQKFMEDRLQEEEWEFQLALNNRDPPSKLWSEGADCCNFRLMMIINAERERLDRWRKR